MKERQPAIVPLYELAETLERDAIKNELGRAALDEVVGFWEDPSDAKQIDELLAERTGRLISAITFIDKRIGEYELTDKVIMTLTDAMTDYYGSARKAKKDPLIEEYRVHRDGVFNGVEETVEEILSPKEVEDTDEKTAEPLPKTEVSEEEKRRQAEKLASALLSKYEEHGEKRIKTAPLIHENIYQAAASGRTAIFRLLREGGDEEFNQAVSKLMPNARDALPNFVMNRLIQAQKCSRKRPQPKICREAPLWKMDDFGQEIVASKIAISVAEEMALNAQLAGVEGAPEVADPRFFRPPEKRGKSDFMVGDEIVYMPSAHYVNVQAVGIFKGTVQEIKTGGKKGTRIVIRVEKEDGKTTDYHVSPKNRQLIHEPCWTAFRHSKSLRESWKKHTNEIPEKTHWPPLAT